MGKIKIKNATVARVAKLEEVFGVTEPYVPYEVQDNKITFPNDIVAEYTKEVKDIKGYDLLKDITIEVTVADKEFTLNWQQDHGVMWIVHACVNKMIATQRVSNGQSAADKAKLKEERARFLAAKKK